VKIPGVLRSLTRAVPQRARRNRDRQGAEQVRFHRERVGLL